MKERASELSAAHWSYVESVLEAHQAPASEVDVARFHYQTAFEHGYKHAWEDAKSAPLPGSERYQEIHTPLSGKEVSEMVDAVIDTVMFDGKPRKVGPMPPGNHSVGLKHRVFPVDYRLPTITLPGTAEEVWEKFKEERNEWMVTEHGSLEELIELWDCIQALQTYKERGGRNDTPNIFIEMGKHAAAGRDVMGAKWLMMEKNAKRTLIHPFWEQRTGYYAPEVCKAILDGTWMPSSDASF